MVDLRIAGGRVVTTDAMLDADVLVDGETITGVVSRGTGPEADETVGVGGKLVFLGVVDPHVHIDGLNSIDSYENGTAAAALGGVTSIINFAWQPWVGDDSIWDTPGSIHDGLERQQRLGADSLVDYGLHGTFTRGDPASLDKVEALVETSVTPFKLFTIYAFGLSSGFVKEAFERIAGADLVVFDPTERYTGSAADNESTANYSIYEGREVTRRVNRTYRRGELIAGDGEVVADPGSGAFAARSIPDWAA